MPRGGILYGLIPAEMDANGAAAKFLRERRPESIGLVLNSDHNVLARSNTDPGPLSDLPTKMVAFLYLLREAADDPARSQGVPLRPGSDMPRSAPAEPGSVAYRLTKPAVISLCTARRTRLRSAIR